MANASFRDFVLSNVPEVWQGDQKVQKFNLDDYRAAKGIRGDVPLINYQDQWKDWQYNQLLGGRTPSEYWNSLHPNSWNAAGTTGWDATSFDPNTGQVTYNPEYSDASGNLVMAGIMAGVGGLRGGFGLGELFSGGVPAAETGAGEMFGMTGYEGGSTPAGTGFTSATPSFKGGVESDWFRNPDFLDSINYDFGPVGGATKVDMTGFLSQGADPFAFTPDPSLATGGAGGVGTLTGGNLGEFSLAQLPGGSLSSGLGVLGVAAPAGVEPSIWQKAVEFIKNGKSVAEVGKIFGLGEGATKILGSLGASALGAIGSSAQSDAYERLAREYMGYGAPYRGRLSELYADPSSFLGSPEVTVPINQATRSLAQALSVEGNPFMNPGAQNRIESYAANQLFGRLGEEKNRLGAFGGLTSLNAAAPATMAASIGANKGIYDSIGYGLGNILNPQPSLVDLLKQFGGLNQLSVV